MSPEEEEERIKRAAVTTFAQLEVIANFRDHIVRGPVGGFVDKQQAVVAAHDAAYVIGTELAACGIEGHDIRLPLVIPGDHQRVAVERRRGALAEAVPGLHLAEVLRPERGALLTDLPAGLGRDSIE